MLFLISDTKYGLVYFSILYSYLKLLNFFSVSFLVSGGIHGDYLNSLRPFVAHGLIVLS
jgi:hypothetical protein